MNHLFQHIQGHLYGAFRPRLLPTGGATAFSPLSLFAASEQGAWYDPSDFSSMFQDSAGTTPVTAVEQPVGLILDKRLGLARGAELNGDVALIGNGFWGANSDITIGSGKIAFVNTPLGNAAYKSSVFTFTAGLTYEVAITVANYVSGSVRVEMDGAVGTFGPAITANGTYTARLKSNASVLYFTARTAGTTLDLSSVSVRELPGNHATQATAAARPVVSARVNLLTYTEDFSNAIWAKTSCTATSGISDPLGGTSAFTITATSADGRLARYGSEVTTTSGVTYTMSAHMRRRTGTGDVQFYSQSAADYFSPTLALTTEWQRFTWTFTSTSTLADIRLPHIYTSGDAIDIWHPQLEIASTATRYQRVTTATDYDTAGFPHYLVFDGIDDSLATAAVDLTGTYQVSAFAGFSVSYVGNFATLYANGWAYESGEPNAGNFVAFAPENGSGHVRFDQGGVTTASNVTVSVDGTAAHVYVQSMDSTASPYQVIRVDGVQVATSTVNVGGQPFAGTAIKIADRDHGFGASFFSGKLYQLIIRGAASTEAEINATEAYIASKSGATL